MFSLRNNFKAFVTRSPLTLLVILGAVFAAYCPALNGQLIWDDAYLVGENPFFRSPVFSLEVFRHYLFIDSLSVYYRPVQNLSYMLDYWVWKGDPFGYHFTNLLLHSFSAFFLFLLLKQILPSLLESNAEEHRGKDAAGILAFCVGLVWAVHPIHNAAVAYIAGRADSLISLFALSAWLVFLKSNGVSPRWRWPLRAVVLLAALLALCSKEAGLLWIVLFLVWTFGFEKQFSRAMRIGSLIAVLGLVGVYAWLHHLPGLAPETMPVPSEPFSQRVFLMFKAMGDYTGLIFWPEYLHMERSLGTSGPYPDLAAWMRNVPYEYKGILGMLALSFMALGALSRSPGRQLRLLGMVWFLIGFLPISNLVTLNAQSAEHWIYMASIGFLLFLGGVVIALPRGQVALTTLALVAVIPLGIRTMYRSRDWGDEKRFFNQTKDAGGGTQRIELNLSNLATRRGDLPMAEKMLRATLTQAPYSSLARTNLGINLLAQHDRSKEPEAEKYLTLTPAALKHASKESPYAWTAPVTLAQLRASQDRPGEALSILDEALLVYPQIWDLVALKARLVQKMQGTAAAIPLVEKYVEGRWWHIGAWMTLAELDRANGDANSAKTAWLHASRLDIYNAKPLVELARLCAGQNQFDQALEYQTEAIKRDPDKPLNYLLLAAILDHLNRGADSQAAQLHAAGLLKKVGQ